MTSAFYPIIKKNLKDKFEGVFQTPENYLKEEEEHYQTTARYQPESETEDEEVKISCMGGLRGIDDSDMNSTFSSEEEEESDDESECDSKSERHAPLTFIANLRYSKTVPLRPRVSISGNLSPPLEGSEEEDCDERSVGKHSVGARGVPLALDTDEDSVGSEFSLLNEENRDSTMQEAGRWEFDESSSESDEEEDTEGDDASSESSEQDEDDASCSSNEEEDDEVCTMTSSLGEDDESQLDDEEEDTACVVIGVSHDHDRVGVTTLPKAKRVMSFNNLSSLEDSSVELSPKRRKNSSCSEPGLPFLPFCLGDSALDQDPMQTRTLLPSVITNLCSSDDEEEEGRLREELDGCQSEAGDKSPVPLLTPPSSPLLFADEGEYPATVCEWPSNLTIDSAMTAVLSEIRPLSPVSLAHSDIDDVELLKAAYDNTTLTPLLRGMVVRQF